MGERPTDEGANSTDSFSARVGKKAERRLRAQLHPNHSVWLGLGTMGLVGWSVVVPTLIGAGLGAYLDRRYPGTHSCTLALLVAGLILGCFNAWRWLSTESRSIGEKHDDDDQ